MLFDKDIKKEQEKDGFLVIVRSLLSFLEYGRPPFASLIGGLSPLLLKIALMYLCLLRKRSMLPFPFHWLCAPTQHPLIYILVYKGMHVIIL